MAGVLQRAGEPFARRFGLAVAVLGTDDRVLGGDRVGLEREQCRNGRDVHDRITPGVDCGAEHVLRTGQIGGMHLGLTGRFDRHDRSRMDDGVAAGDRRLDRGAIGDVAGDDLAAVDVHALEERRRLRRRSHHHSDIVSVAPQRPDGVAPEKAGRSGDEDLHCPTSTSV